jgi:glucose/arabinose dehydrogenase
MTSRIAPLIALLPALAACAGGRTAVVAPPKEVQVPRFPPSSADAAETAPGFRVELVVSGLDFPTSVEFDEEGNTYVAESGCAYTFCPGPARVLKIDPHGLMEILADHLEAPVNDLLWSDGRLYIAQRGGVSVFEHGVVRDVAGSRPAGDYGVGQLALGADGKIYFGEGAATNSGIAGPDDRARWFGRPYSPHDGAVYRMNPDGTELEVLARGFRDPAGLVFQGETLYISDRGFEDRGPRPIPNAPDAFWTMKKGAYYGYPDFAAGESVVDEEFRSAGSPRLKFLLSQHPPVEQPMFRLTAGAGLGQLAISPGGRFGYPDQIFAAASGSLMPERREDPKAGFAVWRIDPSSKTVTVFLRAKVHALGPSPFEHAATAGPRRPAGLRFSRDGLALYVVDLGALTVNPTDPPSPQAWAGTGAIWRVVRSNMETAGLPAGLSVVPRLKRRIEAAMALPAAPPTDQPTGQGSTQQPSPQAAPPPNQPKARPKVRQ